MLQTYGQECLQGLRGPRQPGADPFEDGISKKRAFDVIVLVWYLRLRSDTYRNGIQVKQEFQEQDESNKALSTRRVSSHKWFSGLTSRRRLALESTDEIFSFQFNEGKRSKKRVIRRGRKDQSSQRSQ
jgi:hypothetical protein